jgi:hypothetical protein
MVEQIEYCARQGEREMVDGERGREVFAFVDPR